MWEQTHRIDLWPTYKWYIITVAAIPILLIPINIWMITALRQRFTIDPPAQSLQLNDDIINYALRIVHN